MFATRSPVAAVALLLAAALGQAQSTGEGKIQPGGTPLVVTLLRSVGDKGLQTELKLAPDQAGRRLAFRQKQWDAEYTTAPKDLKRDELNKATEAEFAAVLSPDQLRRARQLAAQQEWTQATFAGGVASQPAPDYFRPPLSALRRYPEITAALKLDEAQAKIVHAAPDGNFGEVLYLTPAQAEAAKEWLGPPYPARLTWESDPRGTSASRFVGPMPLSLTGSPDVQKELMLTAEQLAAVNDVRRKFPSVAGPARGPGGRSIRFQPDVSPAAAQKAQDEARTQATAAMKAILTPGQWARLEQLDRRRTSGTASHFLEGNAIGKELGITAEQRQAYQAARKTYEDAVAKVALSGEPADKVTAKAAALGKEHAAAVGAILTPAQVAKRKELFGDEFQGRFAGGPGGGFGPGPGSPVDLTRRSLFGKYSAQLSILSTNTALQAELKMTEEQVKKVRAALGELIDKFPAGTVATSDAATVDRYFADRSAFIEKTLADILDKGQFARLRQVQLQQLEAARPTGVTNLFAGTAGYPGVAEEIKLAADQKTRLLDGAASAEVLTDEQKKAIQGMLGKPADLAALFPTKSAPPPSRTERSTLSAAHRLLLTPAYWTAIKLTPEQITKLVPAANVYASQSITPWSGPTPPAANGAVESFTRAADAVLTAEQRTRLGQIALQQRAAASLARLLGTPAGADVHKELGLSAEQIRKVNEITTDAVAVAGVLGRPSAFRDEPGLVSAHATLRDRLDERLLKELTPAQAAKWKEMLGNPEGFTRQPIEVRGGFGGGPFRP